MQLINAVDTGEGAVEVFHFHTVFCQTRTLLVDLRKRVGQSLKLADVGLGGLFHFWREHSLGAAQQFVVGGADDGGEAFGFIFKRFAALWRSSGDGGAGGLNRVNSGNIGSGCGISSTGRR